MIERVYMSTAVEGRQERDPFEVGATIWEREEHMRCGCGFGRNQESGSRPAVAVTTPGSETFANL